MKIVEMELSKLKPLERNAMTHPPDNIAAIRESLRRYGQRRVLVVREATMEVEAGNGTLEAMLAEGWTKATVALVDDDERTARGFALADNRTAQLAAFDPENLLADLRDLGEDAIGWSPEEIDKLLATGDIVDELEQDLGGETPRTLGNPDKPKRQDEQCTLSVVLHARDLDVVEQALAKAREAGAMTRGDQMVAVCRGYIGDAEGAD